MLSGDLSLLLKICQFHLEKRHGPTEHKGCSFIRKISLTERWSERVREMEGREGRGVMVNVSFQTQGASEWSG